MVGAPPCCVVFDVDDTLYLERSYVHSGFQAVGRWAHGELGVSGLGDRCWQHFLQGGRGNTFDAALVASGIEPATALIEAMVAVYRAHEPAIELLPDARACIDALGAAGIPIGVVTDGPLASQQAKVRALGAQRWASAVICTAALGSGYGKPHPEAFTLIERQLGCRGDACVYVADNVQKDFTGPKSLGWRTVRLRRPHSLHETLESSPEVDIELPALTGIDPLVPAARHKEHA